MRLSAAFLPALLVTVVGCGSSTDETPPAPQDPGDPLAEWLTLISADWTIPAGTESYVCARRTIEEDLFIAGFAATASPGIHHSQLTMGVPDAPDGVGPCKFDTSFGVTAFGSAALTEPLVFPPGIATKIPKGVQLLLNVHISNPNQEELSGISTTRIRTISESEVIERADHFAVAKQRVELPARATTTSTGYCAIRSEITLVAVAPHMHLLGKYERVVSETPSQEITLLDSPYKFGEETYRVLEPVKIAVGDRLRVECTHENTTDQLVGTGPRTQDEMCMAAFYKFPIGGAAFCADN